MASENPDLFWAETMSKYVNLDIESQKSQAILVVQILDKN